MSSSGACIPVPSFFCSAEVWPSRLVKLNVHFSLFACARMQSCVCVSVCVSVCVCMCVLAYVLVSEYFVAYMCA